MDDPHSRDQGASAPSSQAALTPSSPHSLEIPASPPPREGQGVVVVSLEEKHEIQNRMFGFKPWKSHVQHRPLSERSAPVQSLYYEPLNVPRESVRESNVTVGNVCWTVFFGWWIAGFYMIAALLMACTIVGIPYAKRAVELGLYYFWPFGKFVVKELVVSGDGTDLYSLIHMPRAWSPLEIVGFVLWCILAVPILFIAHAVALLGTWCVVVMIPMAKVNRLAFPILLRRPLTAHVSRGAPVNTKVVSVAFRAVNRFYYKYSIWGLNIILLNMNVFVVIAILLGYATPHAWRLQNPIPIFIFTLLSVVPLAYCIGAAVSSISAQTSFAVGAILNATFGSIIELILYLMMMLKGLSTVIQQAVTGSLLGTLLFLPGLSMVCGGVKYKEQRFNKKAAGVTSLLLLVAVCGAFSPTLFYNFYGEYEYDCEECLRSARNATALVCRGCHTHEGEMTTDPFFLDKTRPLMYTVSALLPIAYLIGLLFALKTHSHIYKEKPKKKKNMDNATPESQQVELTDRPVQRNSGTAFSENTPLLALPTSGTEAFQAASPALSASTTSTTTTTSTETSTTTSGEASESPAGQARPSPINAPESSGGGHGGAELSKWKCLLILLVATGAFAACSEALCNALGPALEKIGVPKPFAGLTIIAMVPNTAEVVNAVQFALRNDITLSVEIGNSAAVQITMIQIPVLVWMAAIIGAFKHTAFTIIFPNLDLVSVFLSVITINYLSNDGRCNYFQGAALLIIYVTFLAVFWFAPIK